MTTPWSSLIMFVGVLAAIRLPIPSSDSKTVLGLLSFAIAVALLLALALLPDAFEIPTLLLVGVFIGIGVRLLSPVDGYLARDDGPEQDQNL